ncbi:MAG: hypothetical protein AAF726_00890 [Planctomycetota bacterium]
MVALPRRFVLLFPLAVALLAASFALTGCRTFADPGGVKRVYGDGTGNGVYRISWDATRRGTFIIRNGDDVRIVSEPPPDVAMESISKITAKLDLTKQDGSLNSDVTETIKELSRASQISFLRDALYRLNEAYANDAITAAGFSAAFNEITSSAAILIALDKELSGDELEHILAALQCRQSELVDLRVAKDEEAKARLVRAAEYAGEIGADPDQFDLWIDTAGVDMVAGADTANLREMVGPGPDSDLESNPRTPTASEAEALQGLEELADRSISELERIDREQAEISLLIERLNKSPR